MRYANAESTGWAEQCHSVPSPLVGEGQGEGYNRSCACQLVEAQCTQCLALASHKISFLLSASSPPLSLSLPHKGGGNGAARTFATQTLCSQVTGALQARTLLSRTILATSLAALAAGCSSIERLKTVGEQPTLSQINNPTTQTGYKPVQMPMPAPQPASYNPNSLWRNGSRAFFKDQRAHQVGDILTVKVKITDKATLENETQRSRKNSEDSGVTDFLGSKLIKTPASSILPGKILTADSTASSEGKGTIDRKEELLTNVAGVVIQVLPNGNLVIEGKQEVRVNYEVRELVVAGVVRPEDIESDNTIDSTKIAEARIAYGGRGQITDVQQPRYGQQVLDVLLPF
jgi:flagellar L-ring protein precursor FlgH